MPASPPMRSIFKVPVFEVPIASCPWRTSRSTAPLQSDLLPSGVDCTSNSVVARIELSSDGTGTIGKRLHLHGGRRAEARHRLVPDLADLVPAVAADGLGRSCRRQGWECRCSRAGPCPALYCENLVGCWRKAMLCRRVGHVAQAGIALLARRRAHDVLADQPVGLRRRSAWPPIGGTSSRSSRTGSR